ncbi:hypothetical protein [Sphingomonas faeni]|uniref:hypothetical protein n=1 Tax=Sphingomonas faeni TaxID=185950 RepID=UPI0020C7D5E5|nr:hypothetical protein [Sphingomonas faeni]MCP8893035.1 hypothetical protein [Sphingomonas faeni]
MEHIVIERRVLPFRRNWHVVNEVDLAPLLADHAAVRRMCQRAEDLADQLSEGPGLEQRGNLAETVRCCIRDHVKVTGNCLEQLFGGEALRFGQGVLARILLDQISDAVHAEDVIELLQRETLEPEKIDMLSYMLRCLFDNYRRAIDFEELTLLSLAGTRLSAEARLALEHSLERGGTA